MATATICKPSDVIQFAPVKLDFNPCTFRELYNIEIEQARKCFGGLYDDMLAALADYSAAPAYVAGTSYNAGNIVSFTANSQRLYYEALVNTSAIPTLATDWKEAPRFTGGCAESFDDLFCMYYGPYMAHTVLAMRMPYIYTRISDAGIVRYQDNNNTEADDKAYSRLQNAVFRDRDSIFKNFEAYMALDAQKENLCFENYKGYVATSCGCGGTCNKCRAGKLKVGLYDFG